MSRLRDKSILITGAAGGIGSAIAKAIAREGGRAILTDLASHTGMDHALDVTSEEDWTRVIGALSRLDGLVNAADPAAALRQAGGGRGHVRLSAVRRVGVRHRRRVRDRRRPDGSMSS
jgi:NAD(P)-dependent dehydrogenase (short-subunit alcohol dehydrogenase family)